MPYALVAVVLFFCVAACGNDDSSSHTEGDGGSPGAAGADGSGGSPGVCEPNQVEACDCESAVAGARRCLADGSDWGACECVSYGAEFSVSPAGSDTASGSVDEPFGTLEGARDAVRGQHPEDGVVIWLREGTYIRTETFELGYEDSGTAEAPLVLRAYPGEAVRLVGAQVLDGGAFAPVGDDSPVWSRLDSSARDRIVQVDLAAQGVTDFGSLERRGFCDSGGAAALELFIDGEPMTLARWPDADQNDPAPSITGDQVEVFGSLSPDVTGAYLRNGEQDGVSSFAREGLVDGLQYNLHRRTWEWEGAMYTAWFLTTTESGYPTDDDPWWSFYDPDFGTMNPSNGATGQARLISPTRINHGFASVLSAVSDTEFTYSGNRPDRWAAASDVWLHGYFEHAWADCHVAAASIDTATSSITLTEDTGYGIVEAQPYYAYNLLEEITTPGEWYLDRASGILYLYPPGDLAGAEILVSSLAAPVVRLSDTSHVVLQDLVLEGARSELVRIDGGSDNALVGVTLRNSGKDGAVISGTRNGIRHSIIHDTGARGVSLSGGDRPSLEPGENFVENCHIYDFGRVEWTYRPAVNLSGVGHRVSHNLVHDAPHSAILYGGNEHQVELNEIHHVCQFTSDAGAIYAGRDWGARGNVIRHNFVHHIDTWFEGYGVHGVYLDDCLSGIRVEGNVLYEISGHGILHGGGRDNLMINNVIVGCGSGLSADQRGYDWRPDAGPNDTPGDSWNLLEKLQNVGYQSEPWASRYPECAAIPNDWNAIIAADATWLYPEGCVFERNVGYRNTTWTRGEAALTHYASISDNLEDVDPLFVDEDSLNLALQDGSPALELPGFVTIPFGEIGIQP